MKSVDPFQIPMIVQDHDGSWKLVSVNTGKVIKRSWNREEIDKEKNSFLKLKKLLDIFV